jgi:hypothetical protein
VLLTPLGPADAVPSIGKWRWEAVAIRGQAPAGTGPGQWALALDERQCLTTDPLVHPRAPHPRCTSSARYRGETRRCTIAGMTTLAGGIRVAQAPQRSDRSGGAGNPADLLRWAHRLTDSAEAVSTAAASPGSDAAIAAALGHIETALEHLERGAEQMERLARARLTQATAVLGEPWNDVVVARTARDFEDLGRALANARRACGKVRQNAGPILAELAAV